MVRPLPAVFACNAYGKTRSVKGRAVSAITELLSLMSSGLIGYYRFTASKITTVQTDCIKAECSYLSPVNLILQVKMNGA